MDNVIIDYVAIDGSTLPGSFIDAPAADTSDTLPMFIDDDPWAVSASQATLDDSQEPLPLPEPEKFSYFEVDGATTALPASKPEPKKLSNDDDDESKKALDLQTLVCRLRSKLVTIWSSFTYSET